MRRNKGEAICLYFRNVQDKLKKQHEEKKSRIIKLKVVELNKSEDLKKMYNKISFKRC